MDFDLCNVEKGLEGLFRYAYGMNAGLEDSSGTTDDSKSLENLDLNDVQDSLKDLVLDLLSFKSQYKSTDKAELVLRTEQFETLLQKLETELRNHITVENQLKMHIEHHENQIEELEKAEVTDKKTIRKLEGKFGVKKLTKNAEAEKVRKEMEEKIRELEEISEKKEKILHKIEFENIKLRNLLEEKGKECENVKKEIIKYTRLTPQKRDNSLTGSENIKNQESNGRMRQSARKREKSGLGNSVDEPEMPEILSSPEKKVSRSNTMNQNIFLKGRTKSFLKSLDNSKN